MATANAFCMTLPSFPPSLYEHWKKSLSSTQYNRSSCGFCNHGSRQQVQGRYGVPLVRGTVANIVLSFNSKDFNSIQVIHTKESGYGEWMLRIAQQLGTAWAWALIDSPAAMALTEYSDGDWVRIWITTGIVLFLYLLAIPPFLFNYLRLRWYKRKLPEAFLQFMLVFLFFPGLMLWAPFINFRMLPTDPSKKTPWT